MAKRETNDSGQGKILIVKTSSLGDIIHTFPAVHALCRHMGCRCDWVVEPQFSDMLDYLPCVDRHIIFHKKKFKQVFGFLPAFFGFLKEVRRERYTAVIDFQGLMRNAILGWLAKYDRFAGFCNPKEILSKLLYTETYIVKHRDVEEHAILKNNRMVMQFEHSLKEDFKFDLPVLSEAAAEVSRMDGCGTPKRYVAIVPGARWETKEWPADFFANSINLLQRQHPDFDFVAVGSRADFEKAERIHTLLNPNATARFHNLCGKTSLQQLTELLRNAAACLTNDSGPMHIAAATKTPVVALFGPTSPELTGPYSENSIVLMPNGIDCLKCFNRHCSNMHCHSGISPESVLTATDKLLKKERIS